MGEQPASREPRPDSGLPKDSHAVTMGQWDDSHRVTRPASREPRSGEPTDEELDALLAAYFDDRRDAMVNVIAHKTSPPEYPGLALVPVPDLERLERFLEPARRLGQSLVWRESMAYESGFEAGQQVPSSGPDPARIADRLYAVGLIERDDREDVASVIRKELTTDSGVLIAGPETPRSHTPDGG